MRSGAFGMRGVQLSGNGIHIPLHADGVGAVQLDVQRTGVVQHLLRRARTAQHVQPRDHAGGQGDHQLRQSCSRTSRSGRPSWASISMRLRPAGGLEAGVRVAGAALGVGGVHGHLAGQQALLQRGVGLHRHAQLPAGGQQLLFHPAGQQAVLFLNDIQLAVLAVAADDVRRSRWKHRWRGSCPAPSASSWLPPSLPAGTGRNRGSASGCTAHPDGRCPGGAGCPPRPR